MSYWNLNTRERRLLANINRGTRRKTKRVSPDDSFKQALPRRRYHEEGRKAGQGAELRKTQTHRLTDKPCPRCLALAKEGRIRAEMVQRLPASPWAPLARDKSGPCCFDCASADAVMRLGMDFNMARVAVGNDRQEQYRLPGAPVGMVQLGLVRPSKPGDLEDQHAWLDRHGWFDIKEDCE